MAAAIESGWQERAAPQRPAQLAEFESVRGGQGAVSASGGGAMGWLLVILTAAVIVGVFVWLQLGRASRLVPMRRTKQGKRVQWMIQKIQSHQQLVDAFDEFVLWRHGAKASSWNSGHIRATLRAADPHAADQIDALVQNYAVAKYGPLPEPLDVEQIADSMKTLHELAMAEMESSRGAIVTAQESRPAPVLTHRLGATDTGASHLQREERP